MKKVFTLFVFLMGALATWATDYTDTLIVKVNQVSSSQKATISVEEKDGLYTLTLKNFILETGGSKMPVGNIQLTQLTPETSGDNIVLNAHQDIQITSGDDPAGASWMGPILGTVPVNLKARLTGDKLFTAIGIEMAGQSISVTFGSGMQLNNPGFEYWHTSKIDEEDKKTYQEPNGWHSFESGKGSLISLAGHHIAISNDAHSGNHSACIFSSSVFGIIANGTMTTGRMNADGFAATDTKNHAHIDPSDTNKDGNGDPFYATITNRPDSMVVYLKFKQGTVNDQHPYATVSAALTDGTYYQEPQNKTYTNVIATAQDKTIATTDGKWKRVAIPFAYTGYEAAPKHLFVTISTNADPGQGSDKDSVWVDDISLVYNAKATNITVAGKGIGFNPATTSYQVDAAGTITADDIAVTLDGQGAFATKTLTTKDGMTTAIVKVYSADLQQTSSYALQISSATGIQNIPVNGKDVRIYNVSGQQVKSMQHGNVYILKDAQGHTKKVAK